MELIYAYTRTQAIADGVLVDVTETAKEAGFRIPVALTHAVWAEYVAVPEGLQDYDEPERLWKVLWMCRFGTSREKSPGPEVFFWVCVRNHNREAPLDVRLKAVCGPDDAGAPCITIMLSGED